MSELEYSCILFVFVMNVSLSLSHNKAFETEIFFKVSKIYGHLNDWKKNKMQWRKKKEKKTLEIAHTHTMNSKNGRQRLRFLSL